MAQRRRRMPEDRAVPKRKRRRPRERLSEFERGLIQLALVNVMARMVEGITSGRAGHCVSCARLADARTGRVSCAKKKCACHSRAARMLHGCPFHGAERN